MSRTFAYCRVSTSAMGTSRERIQGWVSSTVMRLMTLPVPNGALKAGVGRSIVGTSGRGIAVPAAADYERTPRGFRRFRV